MSTAVIVLLLVVVVGAYGALVFASEPGPNAVAVLLRRYGAAPLAGTVALATLLAASVVVPDVAAVIVTFCAAVLPVCCLVLGWGPSTWRRAARRCVLRARWTSVARSSELAVQRDHRVPGVGADAGTLTDIVRLEWTPTIRRGRALPNRRGVVYRLTPARGSSLTEVAKQTERLAAGLGVAEVVIERERPNRGRLTVLWES